MNRGYWEFLAGGRDYEISENRRVRNVKMGFDINEKSTPKIRATKLVNSYMFIL